MSSESTTKHYFKAFHIGCFILASLLLAWVLSAVEIDSPYVSTEIFQQVYLTDEGLYTKGATWFSKHRELFQPVDFCVAHILAPLYLLTLGSVFQIFGDTWRVARTFSLFMSFLALGSFWLICRKSLPPMSSWLATLSVAFAFQYLHAARLATADPFGIALCIISAAAWMYWGSTVPGTILALLIAVAAVLCKTGYGPFFGALALCVAIEILLHWRRQDRLAACVKAVVLAMAVVFLAGLRHYFTTRNPALANYVIQFNLSSDLGIGVSIGTALRYQLHSLFPSAALLPGTPVLLVAVLFALLSSNGLRGYWDQILTRLRMIAADPLCRLFLLWAAGGVVLFGVTSVQGARYYLFLVFVFSYMTFWGIHHLTPGLALTDSRRMALLVAILHLASQSNLYLHWFQQAPAYSYIAISRDIAARITADNPGNSNVLAHGLSDWLSLFDSRITGVDWGYDSLETVQPRKQRILHWRPRYVIVNEDDVWLNSKSLQALIADNSQPLAAAEPMAEYRLLFRNVFPSSPDNCAPNVKLLRLRYR